MLVLQAIFFNLHFSDYCFVFVLYLLLLLLLLVVTLVLCYFISHELGIQRMQKCYGSRC